MAFDTTSPGGANAPLRRSRRPPRTPAPPTLRQAMTFIEQHAAEDIHAEDIARAAAVTVRSVQLVFRRYLDTTPGAYLREVRLHNAHSELQRTTRDRGGTVARVAARWHFSSASRFAAHYRHAYGVLPSQTLDA